jgi:hypothetical protein
MKLTEVIGAQAIRFFDDISPENEPAKSPIPLVRALQDRYGFVQVPNRIEDFNFSSGVNFLRGFFQGVIIEKFQVYDKGVVCETKADTDFSDLFLDDLLGWAISQFKLPVRQGSTKVYFSQIEVQATADLGKAISTFSSIGDAIVKSLNSYGQKPQSFQLSGIKLHTDISSAPPPAPPEFVFERRSGQPYQSLKYFSTAPLKTKDHLAILERLEKSL